MSEEVKSASEQKKEDWMNSKWRPMMGWMYMLVCTADFILFPVMWSLLQTFAKVPITQWMPLTLQGAGLFHIAMGAVLGIAAFGRTQEKLGGANNGGAQLPSSGFTTPSAPSAGFGAAPGGFSSPAPVTNSFGAQPLGGGGSFGSPSPTPTTSFSPAPSWGSTPTGITTTASGKKIVPQDDQPVL
jgi:hypothetical protein